MSEWRHPTMADDGRTEPVRCQCGRTRRPGEMLDVRGVGVGVAYLCGACVEDLFRKDVVDRLTFYRRAGAPVDWLAAHEAKLAAGPLHRAGLPRHIWGGILADALNEIHGSPSTLPDA